MLAIAGRQRGPAGLPRGARAAARPARAARGDKRGASPNRGKQVPISDEPVEAVAFGDIVAGALDVEDAPDAPGFPKRVLPPQAELPKLHKVLAQAGLGSRLEMERMIADGAISVNNQPAHVGQRIQWGDKVRVKGKLLRLNIAPPMPRVLAYHKPAGEVVTHDDPQNRPTVFRRLPRLQQGKWQSVGRLDLNTEGLLLLTSSGELANSMMHPSFGLEREYAARVLGALTAQEKEQLLSGIELEDGPAQFGSISDGGGEGANQWYQVTINEGRNREVRRMFEHLGLTVSRLIRTSYGCVQMPSWLKRGQFKLLDEAETFNVLESVGLRSKKKLEKAARFGGRNKLPQQPLGPMRSATEHEAIWTGAPADAGMGQGRRGRNAGSGGAGQGGRNKRGRGGAPGAAASLTQQQFPGFGGATEMQPAGRRQRTPGNKVKRGRNGEVNGNVAPGYQPPSGQGQGNRGNNRNRRRRGRNGGGKGGDAGGGVAPAADIE